MDKNINLVTGKSFDLEKQQKRIKIAKVVAIFSLTVVVLISLILFLITFFLPISSVKKTEQETLTNISLLHKKLVSFYLVKDRIDNIATTIDKRENYGIVSSAVLQKVPSQLSIETLSIDDKILTVVVTGTSLIPINQVIDDLVVMSNQKKLIKNLLIQSLSLSAQTGRYSLSLQADVL